jgi:hypothetical protein
MAVAVRREVGRRGMAFSVARRGGVGGTLARGGQRSQGEE